MNKKVIVRYILDQALSVAAAGVAMFWPAGRLNWWSAWAVLAVWLVTFAAMDLLLLRLNPGLMAERLSPPGGAKHWDKVILSILRLLQLARYILAGFDQRFGWTGGFPLTVQVTGLAVCIIGQALLIWAMLSNAFFSQVVRIQPERGHAVAAGGPYRLVRHPGYAGVILFELALPALLASWPAMALSTLCSLLIVLRTALEDRTLHRELAGYLAYASRVRYRLVPGIW